MAGQQVKTITEGNFDTEVVESGAAVLLDFYADWCGPCKQIAPMIDELASKYSEKGLTVGKVNIDNDQSLAAKFGISGIPTLLFFKGGEKVDVLVGAQSQPMIEQKIEQIL